MLGYFLEGVNEFETRWIGWAGVNVPDEIGQRSLTKALAEKVHQIWPYPIVLMDSELENMFKIAF